MILDQLKLFGVVPVVRIDDVETSVQLAQALIDGGLACAEITFRTAEAEESIRRISKAFPDMLVGAGTVLNCEQVEKALYAGAKFMVSPGLNPEVVRYCIQKGVTVIPGCSCPSDIEQALSLGLTTVKFFPAEVAGGIKAIKAMAAPYTNVKFIPTGGINAGNLMDYLSFPQVVACGGSWMVSPDIVTAGKFDTIRKLTNEAVHTILGFQLEHIGINTENEQESEQLTKRICQLFGFEFKAGNSSNFAGNCLEIIKSNFLGKNGHIAIGTNSIERAMYYLKGMGVEFREETIKENKKGQTVSVYLNEDFGGFALHLVQKA